MYGGKEEGKEGKRVKEKMAKREEQTRREKKVRGFGTIFNFK